MIRLFCLFAIISEIAVFCTAYRMLTPISNYIIEAQKKEGPKYESHNELRFTLHEVVQEAFNDALLLDSDKFSEGVAESEQKILLLGDRIFGSKVSNFCGSLASRQLFPVPVPYRDGIHFKPTKLIPIPVTNLTVLVPSRWFRNAKQQTPLIFVCYEGDSFLKIQSVQNSPELWERKGKFYRTFVSSPFNERCRIREVMVVLDDGWNNRYLLPRNLDARAIIETKSILPRVMFTDQCDPKLGLEQPCCLWKFHFEADGERREFHRCFGSIPAEALKSTQIPDTLSDLLLRGKMSRRFISPPTKACREMEFTPMTVKRPDGHLMTMNRLDATRCGAFF